MKNSLRSFVFPLCVLLTLTAPGVLRAESQGTEYKGVADPFGDPANYEFSEDEKEDKEFFHLGRYLMLGVDLGIGIFTGGLGKTVSPGFYAGAKLLYFFDKQIALEAAAHYANHLDSIHPTQDRAAEIDTNMVPFTLGLRYYFSTQNAPKAIAVANPYLVAGGGMYLRTQNVVFQKQLNFNGANTTTSNFGGYGGGGVEFSIYHKHVFLGLDLRYHFIFFSDADSTLGGLVQPGDRSGNYFTTAATISYNF